MADWFRFAGVQSSNFGVIVQDFPPLTLAKERAEFKPVPGSSGSLTLLEGVSVYEDIVLSVGCYVCDLEKIDLISAWLRGSGDLVLGNQPDRSYKARCTNQIELAKIMRGRKQRTFNAVFRCSPYRYVYPEPLAQPFTSSPASISNPGTVDAEPIITVVGSGNISVTVNGYTIGFESLASDATIDCATGMVYSGTTNLTDSLIAPSEWPIVLSPGANAISWTGSVTSVTVSRPWRYI